MRDRKKIILIIMASFLLIALVFSAVNKKEVKAAKEERYVQHIVQTAAGADPSLGVDHFENDDFTVDETFTSHLPLVIFDLQGQKIPDEVHYHSETDSFELEDGVDPYIKALISIIDNENQVNMLGDEPAMSSCMRVKYRGNSSLKYAKHQYRINLEDENGVDNPQNIMGMGEEVDWILNISMADPTLIRNYLAYNVVGQFMDYVPDVRYCELIIKDGDTYRYDGLYMMNEVIEQGPDRVNLPETKRKNNYTSYLLRRDRFDDDGVMLETYATMNELCYGWLDLRYPKGNKVTPEVVDYVTNDISAIEKVLFSEDTNVFLTYPQYIDVDSFVDYFIINEFFTNYDAGNNSTYMYKIFGNKLRMGPIWDYDGCLDNWKHEVLNTYAMAFPSQPWFAQLVRDDDFCKKLIDRYQELRETYFSDEYINAFIDDTNAYLGSARDRDWSRWHSEYEAIDYEISEDVNGIGVDRNDSSHEAFLQRMKDTLYDHSIYLNAGLHELRNNAPIKTEYRAHMELGVIFVIVFFMAIAVVRRMKRV